MHLFRWAEKHVTCQVRDINRAADGLRVKTDLKQLPPGFAFARDWLKTHHVCPYWLQVTQVSFLTNHRPLVN